MSNQRALVTGGSKGVGFSIAQALIQSGFQVLITGRNPNTLDGACSELDPTGLGKVRGQVADVRDFDALQRASQMAAENASLDVLIVNAGVGVFKTIDELTLEDWNSVIETNLTGAFHTVKAALPYLKAAQGHIILISSLAGNRAFSGGAAYNASKFGLVGFAEALMLDVRQQGIRVSEILPGSIATEFSGHPQGEKDAWKIQPQDIAQTVLNILQLPKNSLMSRVEVRPSQPIR
ncbi:MAG: SDR family oxidoreductase [Deinococcaceae bacterium]